MGDSDPTTGEVSRSLGQFREEMRGFRSEVRDGLADISKRFESVVHRDVYEADNKTRQIQYDDLKADIAAMEKADAEAKASRDSNRRWIIAAIIIPIGVALVELLIAVKSGGVLG